MHQGKSLARTALFVLYFFTIQTTCESLFWIRQTQAATNEIQQDLEEFRGQIRERKSYADFLRKYLSPLGAQVAQKSLKLLANAALMSVGVRPTAKAQERTLAWLGNGLRQGCRFLVAKGIECFGDDAQNELAPLFADSLVAGTEWWVENRAMELLLDQAGTALETAYSWRRLQRDLGESEVTTANTIIDTSGQPLLQLIANLDSAPETYKITISETGKTVALKNLYLALNDSENSFDHLLQFKQDLTVGMNSASLFNLGDFLISPAYAFTPVELMIVVVLIAIIALIGVIAHGKFEARGSAESYSRTLFRLNSSQHECFDSLEDFKSKMLIDESDADPNREREAVAHHLVDYCLSELEANLNYVFTTWEDFMETDRSRYLSDLLATASVTLRGIAERMGELYPEMQKEMLEVQSGIFAKFDSRIALYGITHKVMLPYATANQSFKTDESQALLQELLRTYPITRPFDR